ncbi:Activity-dependent neuroprotector homeobox protein, partial [Clarias magur]
LFAHMSGPFINTSAVIGINGGVSLAVKSHTVQGHYIRHSAFYPPTFELIKEYIQACFTSI